MALGLTYRVGGRKYWYYNMGSKWSNRFTRRPHKGSENSKWVG